MLVKLNAPNYHNHHMTMVNQSFELLKLVAQVSLSRQRPRPNETCTALMTPLFQPR